jgi:ribosomal-protein-alanine N-acetyltransferase
MTAVTRPLSVDDAGTLTRLVSDNRVNHAPWEPVRDPEFFTVDGQRDVITSLLDRQEYGLTIPHVILNEDGEVAGRITLDGITRGAFQSCTIGYWVALDSNGRGRPPQPLHAWRRSRSTN